MARHRPLYRLSRLTARAPAILRPPLRAAAGKFHALRPARGGGQVDASGAAGAGVHGHGDVGGGRGLQAGWDGCLEAGEAGWGVGSMI